MLKQLTSKTLPDAEAQGMQPLIQVNNATNQCGNGGDAVANGNHKSMKKMSAAAKGQQRQVLESVLNEKKRGSGMGVRNAPRVTKPKPVSKPERFRPSQKLPLLGAGKAGGKAANPQFAFAKQRRLGVGIAARRGRKVA